MSSEKVKGDATKARIYAAIIDNLLALISMAAFVSLIGEFVPSLTIVVVGVGYLGYFFLTEGIWGRTPGKYFQGLIVRRLDGGRAGWTEALVRTVLRLLEANPVLLGGLPAGLVIIGSAKNQRLGDMAAGTVVISDKMSLDPASNVSVSEPAD